MVTTATVVPFAECYAGDMPAPRLCARSSCEPWHLVSDRAGRRGPDRGGQFRFVQNRAGARSRPYGRRVEYTRVGVGGADLASPPVIHSRWFRAVSAGLRRENRRMTYTSRITTTILLAVAVLAMSAQPIARGDPVSAPVHQPPLGVVDVVRGFDQLPHEYAAGHRGVDLRARNGEAALASADGVVTFAGSVAGRGVVTVEHADGIRTTYEPLAVAVQEGERIPVGHRLGEIVAGHCAELCLHWGARSGKEYIDPLSLLGYAKVRLLPV